MWSQTVKQSIINNKHVFGTTKCTETTGWSTGNFPSLWYVVVLYHRIDFKLHQWVLGSVQNISKCSLTFLWPPVKCPCCRRGWFDRASGRLWRRSRVSKAARTVVWVPTTRKPTQPNPIDCPWLVQQVCMLYFFYCMVKLVSLSSRSMYASNLDA